MSNLVTVIRLLDTFFSRLYTSPSSFNVVIAFFFVRFCSLFRSIFTFRSHRQLRTKKILNHVECYHRIASFAALLIFNFSFHHLFLLFMKRILYIENTLEDRRPTHIFWTGSLSWLSVMVATFNSWAQWQ